MKKRSMLVWALAALSFAVPALGKSGGEDFQYRLKVLALPEFLGEGQMFLDPELAAGNWFGGGLAVGDWNEDGSNDLFISSFLADPDGVANAGAIYVFFGPDFTETERITAPEPEEGDNFGMQVEFQDLNGDGIADLAASCLRSRFYPENDGLMLDQAGSVRVLWGPDYTDGLRFFDDYPEASAMLGRGMEVADFNEDGHPDIVAGAIGAYGSLGKVIFCYGPEFTQQEEILSPIIEDGMRFGANLAVGDWDVDGHIDLMVGCDKAYSESNLSKAGHVQIWYGPDYSEDDVTVIEEPNPAADNNFGAALDFGDLTGDGVPDLVVGKSGAQWDGKGWVGQIVIFPGPDYAEVIELNSPLRAENSIFGSEVVVADVNGDGLNDLVAGEYYATVDGKGSAGRAWLFIGATTGVSDWDLY